jgi:hypothetical protein
MRINERKIIIMEKLTRVFAKDLLDFLITFSTLKVSLKLHYGNLHEFKK